MELVEIAETGSPARPIVDLPEIAADVMHGTSEMYKATGYRPPWVGYLALVNDACVGTCAFKTPPVDGRVEIAYFTFPGHEGKGVATDMARCLIQKALSEPDAVRIYAQTMPEENASTRVLDKLGFHRTAELEHPEDGTVWEWELNAQLESGHVRK